MGLMWARLGPDLGQSDAPCFWLPPAPARLPLCAGHLPLCVGHWAALSALTAASAPGMTLDSNFNFTATY